MNAPDPDKFTLSVAGPDMPALMRDFLTPVNEDKRFHFSTSANNMGALAADLKLGEPDLLIVFGDLAPTPEELARVLGGLKQALVIVLLPSTLASFQGLFEQLGPVRKVYLLPVMMPELLNVAYGLVQTERTRGSIIAPVSSAVSGGRAAAALGTRVLAVISAQGGVGKTTLSTAIAYELGARRSVRTLLCPFDLPSPVPLNMKLNYAPTAAEFFARPGKPGFQDSLQSVKSGETFEVLLAPQETRPYQEAAERSERAMQMNPTAQDLAASITELVRTAYTMMYAGIILDLPVGEGPWTWHPLGLANNVLIVARPTLDSLKAVGHITQLLTTMLSAQHQFQRETIFVVLNMHTPRSGFTPTTFHREAEEAFGWCPPVIATFEYDPAVPSAQDAQRPVAEVVDTFNLGIQNLTEFFWKGTSGMEPQKAKGKRFGIFNIIPDEKKAA
ncbi:MAG: hypothetical protein ABSB41_17335 [Anaerolineales bacterium]|jgi:cellulose biosynthesis protein BcsQ